MKKNVLMGALIMFAMMLSTMHPIAALEPLTVNLTGATENQVTFTLEKGDQTTVNFVNQTDQTMNLVANNTMVKNGNLSRGPEADQDLSDGKDLSPHETLPVHFSYGSPTGTGSTTITMSYKAATIKQYQTSQSEDNPVVITASGTYEGGGGPSYDYFALQLTQPSYVKVTMEGEASIIDNYSAGHLESANDRKSIDTRAKAGKYILQIAKPQERLAEYKLHVSLTPISYGQLVIEPAHISINQKTNVKVKLVGADPIVHLSYVNHKEASGQEHTFEVDGSTLFVGKKTIPVTYGDELAGYEEKELSLMVVTGKPALSLENFTAVTNSISYSGNFPAGGCYKVMLYKNKKWQKVKDLRVETGAGSLLFKKQFTINGLKAVTKYRVRLDPYTKVDGKTYYGKSSAVFTISTGLKSAPPIKSIKISKVKFKKGYRTNTWVKGYWFGNTYYPGHYVRIPDRTSFTVTVTLNKKLKGTKGLVINGKKVSGRSKTFKKTMLVEGNIKGKKYDIVVSSFKDHNYGGLSKGVKRKVTIK